ncbi:unnamed protein product, partial [Rotaria magnacalcarata]
EQQQQIVTPSPPIVLHNHTNASLHQQQPIENIFDGSKYKQWIYSDIILSEI